MSMLNPTKAMARLLLVGVVGTLTRSLIWQPSARLRHMNYNLSAGAESGADRLVTRTMDVPLRNIAFNASSFRERRC